MCWLRSSNNTHSTLISVKCDTSNNGHDVSNHFFLFFAEFFAGLYSNLHMNAWQMSTGENYLRKFREKRITPDAVQQLRMLYTVVHRFPSHYAPFPVPRYQRKICHDSTKSLPIPTNSEDRGILLFCSHGRRIVSLWVRYVGGWCLDLIDSRYRHICC